MEKQNNTFQANVLKKKLFDVEMEEIIENEEE